MATAVTGERPWTVSPLGWLPEPAVTVGSRVPDEQAQRLGCTEPAEVGTSRLTLDAQLRIVKLKPEVAVSVSG